MGQSPDSRFYNTSENGLPFLQGCGQFGRKYPKPLFYCSSPSKIAQKGAVLFSVRAPVGEINIADRDYAIGRGLAVIQADGIDDDLLYYLLSYVRPQLERISQGSTFKAISSGDLASCSIPYLGNEKNQRAIAQILTTVDRAIKQTEALIAKYQRIKTGLMQDLLTRGIDENGQLRHPATHKFKPSPLGMIPEEWDVTTLGKESRRITSGSRWWAKYYAKTGALFIRIGNLTRKHINLRFDDVQYVNAPAGSEALRTRLETGDLLISVTADLGIIGVVPQNFGEAYINQHIALAKLDHNEVHPWWVGNFLAGHVAQQFFTMLNESGAKAGLNLPTIASLKFRVSRNSRGTPHMWGI